MIDRLHPLFRAAFDDLRDGNAALARAAAKGPLKQDGTRMPEQPMLPEMLPAFKIVIERSPWRGAEPRYLWTAYVEGREDDLSRAGCTPVEALALFLEAAEETKEGLWLETEEERLLGEYP